MTREKIRWVISTSEDLMLKLQGRGTVGRLLSRLFLINQFIAFSSVLNLGGFTESILALGSFGQDRPA